TYGYTGMLGGRSLGEIKASVGAGALGNAVLTAQPTFTVGAGFSVGYKHMDAFHVIAGRHKSGAANGASLYLLPRKRNETSTKFTAGIKLAANAEFDAAVHVDEILTKSASTAVSGLAPED